MTLEHAETSQKTRVFSAQSLALVANLFYGEKRDGRCLQHRTAPDHKPSSKETNDGF